MSELVLAFWGGASSEPHGESRKFGIPISYATRRPQICERSTDLKPRRWILCHKTLTVKQIYAEKNVEAAQRIMAEVG
jgi:hypothetical protein